MYVQWLQAGSSGALTDRCAVETNGCLPVYWDKTGDKFIMYQRIIVLCMTGIISSLLATGTAAVEAVRTEAVKEYVEEKQQPASESVTTKTFTTAIVDGKPADDLRAFENTVDTIYFYTVLEGLKGQAVTHRWKYAGHVISNADISVTDDPFSTWSSNKIEPKWTGFWTVQVVDRNNKVIGFGTFQYDHTRNVQMDPSAKAGTKRSGGGGWGGGWGRGRGWGW
jgi:hypothetical protein